MSSHHIVREKQEPALLILSMDNFDPELLGQLLEWSPTVIATQDTAEELTSLGIKVDRVVGDENATDLQSDVKYLSTFGALPIQTMLSFLIAENYAAVNIVTNEFKPDDYIPFVSKINLVILHEQKKTYPVSSGFTKWLPGGDVITLHSQPKDLVSSGLTQTATGQFATLADGTIKLEFAESYMFISETL